MTQIADLKVEQQISFESDSEILTGTIIELYKYPQLVEEDEFDSYTYNIVVEVYGHEENYNLSPEHIK